MFTVKKFLNKRICLGPYEKIKFEFGRNLKTNVSFKERLILQKESKEAPLVFEHKPEFRLKPDDKEIDEEEISHCHLSTQHLPERLLKRTQQVFSKYPKKDVRKIGEEFKKLYNLITTCEKPMDYIKTKPFSNTEEIMTEKEMLLYLRSKNIDDEKAESKAEERREKKSEKIRESQPNENDAKSSELKSNSSKILRDTITYSQNSAIGYLLKKMPATFGAACRIFTEIHFRLPKFKPQNFLDFGAGLGSGSWAFRDIFPETKHIVASEPSVYMRKLGKHLTQDIDNITWVDTLAKTVNLSYAFSFDFIYCGYVLQELPNAETRILVLESLWEKLNENGILTIVENGTPRGFRFIHDTRKHFLPKFGENISIVSPCPHKTTCPAADKKIWCHFDQKIAQYPKTIFPKMPTEKDFIMEKFSYIVFQKGNNLIKKMEECEAPFEKSFHWDRLIRPIISRGGHTIVDLCTTEGNLERRIVAKSHGSEMMRAVKKLRWGDLWRFPKRIPNKYRKESSFRGKRLW